MYQNVSDYIFYQAMQRPEALLAEDDKGQLSYRGAVERIDEFCRRLHKQGLRPGDRVGFVAGNAADLILLIIACGRIGLVSVPINYRLTAPEVGYIVDDAQCKLLFHDAEYGPLLEGCKLAKEQRVCFSDYPPSTAFDVWMAQAVDDDPIEARGGGDDIFLQLYTSGTTGRPKGAQLTHQGFINNNFQVSLAHGCTSRAGDRLLMVAPNFHAVGLSGALWSLFYGAGLIIHREFHPASVCAAIAQHNISALIVVPVMLKMILEHPDSETTSFDSLALVLYGGSPMAPSLLEACAKRLGCKFAQGYGQTEATTGITVLSPESHQQALEGNTDLLSSCGKSVAATEIKIVDADGNTLSPGEIGEVRVKGPQVMAGYCNLPDATRDTVVDGWLCTGDVGYLDDNGYLFLKDRLKDVVISGGENIYPAEVEAVFMAHPDVADVAVIGIEDDKWGEVPKAFVVSSEPPSEEELSRFAREKLAGFKVPKHYQFIDALPRNASGKILKRTLREY